MGVSQRCRSRLGLFLAVPLALSAMACKPLSKGLNESKSRETRAGVSADLVDMRLVARLHRSETGDVHVFAGGYLYVGRVRDGVKPHRVEIYADDGKRLARTVTLKHPPIHAASWGQGGVLITGRAATDQWRSYYTTIRPVGSDFETRTTDIPLEFMIDEPAVGSDGLFFTDVGAGAILLQTSAGPRVVAGGISSPGRMARGATGLWVVERGTYVMGNENLVRVNVVTGGREDVFTEFKGKGITDLLYLPDFRAVAVNEVLTGRMWFVDERSKALISSIVLPDELRGMERVGHCVLGVSAGPQLLSVVDVSDIRAPRLVVTWDLNASGGGEMLRQPIALAFNASTGTVFVRSVIDCAECGDKTLSSVWAVTERSTRHLDECRRVK